MKKWWSHSLFKLLAILVCCVSAASTYFVIEKAHEIEGQWAEVRLLREPLRYKMEEQFDDLTLYYGILISEDNIRAGNTINQDAWNKEKQTLLNTQTEEIRKLEETYEAKINEATLQLQFVKANELRQTRDQAITDVKVKFEARLLTFEKEWISYDLQRFKQAQERIQKTNTLYYGVANDGTVFYNLPLDTTIGFHAEEHFSSYRMKMQQHNNYYGRYTEDSSDHEEYILVSSTADVRQLIVAVDKSEADAYFAQASIYYDKLDRLQQEALQILGGMAVALVAGLLYLVIAAGYHPKKEGVHVLPIDVLYLDVHGVLLGVGFAPLMILLDRVFDKPKVVIAILICCVLLFIHFITSVAKRCKRKELLRHTLIYAILSWFGRGVKKLVFHTLIRDGKIKSFVTKSIACFVIVQLCVYNFIIAVNDGDSFILFVILPLAALLQFVILYYLAGKFVFQFQTMGDGVAQIKSGNLAYRIPPQSIGCIQEISNNINTVSEGLEASIEKTLKSEKLKVDLITNVSHDLKTPLTAIINYTDLLSKKNLSDDEAVSYITVLQQKSAQLKKLVEDLFEIAKVQNGQVTVTLSDVCINDLLNQSLAEYEEKLMENKLDVRVSGLEEKLYISADGNKTWRVFSNIIGNITKYALPSTRVYIDVCATDQQVMMSFKNIANYEMNFDVSEITERFKRGDESRSTEGSGLGLAIAGSFQKTQDADLEIMVDGDLFKVILHFHRVYVQLETTEESSGL